MLCDPCKPPYPLRTLASEFCRLRLAPGCALQRLLTLSLRLSIALCTKPPMPLVGELGLSAGGFVSRAWEVDMTSDRPIPNDSPADAISASNLGAASFCSSSAAIRDFRSGFAMTGADVSVGDRVPEMPLSRSEAGRDMVSNLRGSEYVGVIRCAGASREMLRGSRKLGLACRTGGVGSSLDSPGSPRRVGGVSTRVGVSST